MASLSEQGSSPKPQELRKMFCIIPFETLKISSDKKKSPQLDVKFFKPLQMIKENIVIPFENFLFYEKLTPLFVHESNDWSYAQQTIPRSYIEEFVKFISNNYNIVIKTRRSFLEVKKELARLDLLQEIYAILTINKKKSSFCSAEILKRKLDMSIDHTTFLHVSNEIDDFSEDEVDILPVKSFQGDPSDTELLELKMFFEYVTQNTNYSYTIGELCQKFHTELRFQTCRGQKDQSPSSIASENLSTDDDDWSLSEVYSKCRPQSFSLNDLKTKIAHSSRRALTVVPSGDTSIFNKSFSSSFSGGLTLLDGTPGSGTFLSIFSRLSK